MVFSVSGWHGILLAPPKEVLVNGDTPCHPNKLGVREQD
jgi:hypothetical protein